MKLELDKLVFLFKGYTSPAYGLVPPQIIQPLKVNFRTRKIGGEFNTPNNESDGRLPGGRTSRCSYGFDRFVVCDENDAAAILFNKSEIE